VRVAVEVVGSTEMVEVMVVKPFCAAASAALKSLVTEGVELLGGSAFCVSAVLVKRSACFSGIDDAVVDGTYAGPCPWSGRPACQGGSACESRRRGVGPGVRKL